VVLHSIVVRFVAAHLIVAKYFGQLQLLAVVGTGGLHQ